MALAVIAASACLCTFKVAAPADMAMALHGQHMQMTMDAPAPCDEAEKPCHVVDVADLPQSAALAAPAHISIAAFVAVLPSKPYALFESGPPTPLLRWRVPPPSPVTAQDRRLT